MRKLAVVGVLLLTGCAGSAAHDVMDAYQKEDDSRTCRQLQDESHKARQVIAAVNKDRDDINAADAVDAVIWFPFNLIAKSSNYQNALAAAEKRLLRLEKIKKKKGCE